MNHVIPVTVRGKIATAPKDVEYVCGNSDYTILFDFSEEWKKHDLKTARFKYNGTHQDKVFSGNECPVPIISDTFRIDVGVYAGNLETSTPAYIPAKKSILCGGGLPDDPPSDVYAQLVGLTEEARAAAKDVQKRADAGEFDGEDGRNGSDANVTKKNIAAALGYTPAKDEDVKSLTEEIVKLKEEEETGVWKDLTAEVEYEEGKFPTADSIYVREPLLKTGVLDVSAGYATVEITNVRCGGTAAVWCMSNGLIKSAINYPENKTYTVTIEAEQFDQIIFAALIGGQTPIVTAFKKAKNVTGEDLLNYVKKEEIADATLNVSFIGTGFTTTDGGISNEAGTKYSNWIEVKGGETIQITNALMSAYSCVQYQTVLGKGFYQLASPNTNATFEYTLPRDAVKIRYSVLSSNETKSKVSYVTDYKKFREDFIPSLYVNGLGSRNDYPVITFIDDDGSSSYLTNVKPLLDQYGYKGTLGVITSEVEAGTVLTLSQLNDLKAEGFEIVSHSHTHANEIYKPSENANVTDEAIYNDLLTSKQWLETNGFESEWLVWPFGHYGTKMSRFTHLAIKAGYQFACDSDTGRSNNEKVINTYWLDRVFINNSYALAKYTNLIDSVVENNGWLIISTHAGASDEMGDLSVLRAVVDYVHEKNVKVMTFKEASAVKNNVCSIGYIGDYSGRLYIGRDGKIYN